jgi:thiol:disulfide interchange protein
VVLVLFGLMFGAVHNPAHAKDIAWQRFSDGMARGRSENKKVFLHFYARWCGACNIMENKTFQDPAVVAYINENFIPIKVDTDQEREISQIFRIRLLPDNWFIDEDGKPIGHQPGYITPRQLKGILQNLINENTGQ